MAYVDRGIVKDKRPLWRLSTISNFFWGLINLISVFITTMFSIDKSDAYKKSSKRWDGGPGGGGGGGGYGGGPRRAPQGMDNVRGIDHSAAPACGSCCGG